MPLIHTLEAYEKGSDEVAFQVPLRTVPLPLLQQLFNADDDAIWNSVFPIGPEHADVLRSRIETTIDLDRYDWYLGTDQSELFPD